MNELINILSNEGPFKDAIRNPNAPEHMMIIKPVANRVRAFFGDELIADTRNAVLVFEIGKSVYDPVIYFPVGDLNLKLDAGTKATHCPLKGDASYLLFNDQEIAWTYNTLDFADCLAGRVAFWANRVRIVEGE